MNELDIFMERLEREINSLTIPGFDYLAQAVRQARLEVEHQRGKKEREQDAPPRKS